MSLKFTVDENDTLIELVKQNPHLYNSELKVYKDLILKNRTWKKISKTLGKPKIICKTRWKHIRDYYKKKRNEAVNNPSGEIDINFFERYKHLVFLEKLSGPKRRRMVDGADVDESTEDESTLSADDSEVSNHSAIDEKYNIIDLEESKVNIAETSQKMIRLSDSESISESHKESIALCTDPLQISEPQQDPAITMFFQSIASTVSKFKPQLQARAKIEIMNIVGRLELENLSEDTR